MRPPRPAGRKAGLTTARVTFQAESRQARRAVEAPSWKRPPPATTSMSIDPASASTAATALSMVASSSPSGRQVNTRGPSLQKARSTTAASGVGAPANSSEVPWSSPGRRIVLAFTAIVITAVRQSSSRLRRDHLGAALGAQALEHAFAPVFLQPGVKAADLTEDLVGDGLLLLARRIGDRLPADGVAVLDGDLREAQALPVAHARRAVDGDRHDRRARFQREAPDAALGLGGHFAGARAPALA